VIELSAHDDGIVVKVLAHPGAKRDAITGERDGALMVSVTAAPEKGKANAAIQSLLARALDCKTSAVSLLTGQTSRHKRFLIAGGSVGGLADRLAAAASQKPANRRTRT
jgi:uncharacterized protein